MNPFDLKAALLAKHAQHVVLIHFPIALFIVGALFDFVAQWTKKQTLAAAAYYNFTMAAIAAVPVVTTGLLAWQWQLEGQHLKGILLQHLVLGCTSAVLIWVVWWIHFRAQRKQLTLLLPAYRLPIEALGVAIVSLTGHLGGFLSGVNAPPG
jgi:uncharacterized membrane protein